MDMEPSSLLVKRLATTTPAAKGSSGEVRSFSTRTGSRQNTRHGIGRSRRTCRNTCSHLCKAIGFVDFLYFQYPLSASRFVPPHPGSPPCSDVVKSHACRQPPPCSGCRSLSWPCRDCAMWTSCTSATSSPMMTNDHYLDLIIM